MISKETGAVRSRASRAAGLALILGLGLVGCNQAPAPAPADLSDRLSIESFRNSSVQTAGNVITVQRSAEGSQGVLIQPAPMILNFDVAGEGAMLRVRQNRQVGYVALGTSNSLMVGPGGASELLFFTREGSGFTVTVTGITECGSQSATTCEPSVIEPVEQGQPDVSGEAATPQ